MSDTQQKIKISYKETSALFASQFIVNTSGEELIVGFSSGPLTDPSGEGTLLPIHTRLAMTREGARRLHALLARALSQGDTQEPPEAARAKLPDLEQ